MSGQFRQVMIENLRKLNNRQVTSIKNDNILGFQCK
uniref:Uncharacterized protein n=1 Tax=Arundo donax TaxID=35708 RepID=A0A0A8ZXK1_ARUDO